jgi:hypothetical protein
MRVQKVGMALIGPALGLTGLMIAAPVRAQTTSSGKWEVEVHGGGMLTANPSSGSVTMPGTGASFSTAALYPPLLRKSSWSRPRVACRRGFSATVASCSTRLQRLFRPILSR